ncbi:hypothetical protein [Gilvimarinus xylanilyticus]|uniref:Uncharacterized protein n=1 Tax=Gilvimarinus xylanilyticus TaxID=2944139 RepID=A0A9X2KTC8_9GAMM|nr:hypothetical protein [Gilvimarinus xylanilyticus]MCP8899052.1 hypothetical protein [Gilvimarinus xylanilyticus]
MRQAISRWWGAVFVCVALSLAGHGQAQEAQHAELRQQMDQKARAALDSFLREEPDLAAQLDRAPGYLVGTGDTLLLGPLGRAKAVAVLVDQRDQSTTYLNITSLGLGMGLGARDGRFLAVIKSPQTLDSLRRGRWQVNPTASSTLGEQGPDYLLHTNEYDLYLRSESGAAIGAGLSLAHIQVNSRLTDTGLARSTIPGRDPAYAGEQGDAAPRQWPYVLPLLAQQVIDRGINLPRPYGAGWIRSDVEQIMTLTDLDVGFNGGAKMPYSFVGVSNAEADIITNQLKLDTWVLPFLNLYATLGEVHGDINMDITLDGSDLLAQLGTDCSKRLPPPACFVLDERRVTFPVRARVNPYTAGGGFVLAGAWHGWVGILPFNLSYSFANDKNFDGRSLTLSPRVGRLISLPRAGNLTVFAGGNYLDSENIVDGSWAIPATSQVLDYRIHQRNQDPWNLLLGFNWDISTRLSVMLEYDGFIGTREAFTSSVTVRF